MLIKDDLSIKDVWLGSKYTSDIWTFEENS